MLCFARIEAMQVGDAHDADIRLMTAAQNETYYETFMQMYAISRCYFMKALHRSEEPLELVANGTAAASAEAADLTIMEVKCTPAPMGLTRQDERLP